jgi:hypothetical protein
MKRTKPKAMEWKAARAALIALATFLAAPGARGCGLDWTLPLAHFEGVEEHGYVAYWEKIGAIDLGNNVVIPVHIGFSSHREASSAVLGKGWIVALLESHVEPVDENSMSVVMPDGWTFLFLRNGNTQTWRGNAGWAGETNDTLFTIAAPCGWRIKFDGGKIEEIDGSAGAFTYRYDGGVPTEIDHDGRPVLQVERDPVTGAPATLQMGDEKIAVALAARPRVINVAGQNLINGFDPSLASLQWADGHSEQFQFGTDKDLNPTLTISGTGALPRLLTWDAATRQIKSDGAWTYRLEPKGNHLRLTRFLADNTTESYEADDATGMTAEKKADGAEIVTYRFAGGPLAGFVRRIEQVNEKGALVPLYAASYYPSGALLREVFQPDHVKFYSETRQLLKETIGDRVIYERDLDDRGRVVHIVDTVRDLEVKKVYDANGGQTTQVFRQGKLFYTEKIDSNNKLVSLNEGGP